ncbi:unnamed protein product, partial [Prorocentrum cordatum]
RRERLAAQVPPACAPGGARRAERHRAGVAQAAGGLGLHDRQDAQPGRAVQDKRGIPLRGALSRQREDRQGPNLPVDLGDRREVAADPAGPPRRAAGEAGRAEAQGLRARGRGADAHERPAGRVAFRAADRAAPGRGEGGDRRRAAPAARRVRGDPTGWPNPLPKRARVGVAGHLGVHPADEATQVRLAIL